MKVSLILATFGRTDEVARCLQSLVAQVDRHFEVILVDQNPDDRLVQHVQWALSNGLTISHLRLDKPSLSGARNLGIAKASGDIIGLTDDDCWYEPDTIAAVRHAFLTDGDVQGIVVCWVEQAAARSGAPASGRLSLEQWRKFRGGDASSISLFFKKSLMEELGGFDERFGLGQWFGAGEETDFVLRALTSNVVLKHWPSARVHHHFGTVTALPLSAACKQLRQRARGTGGIYAKHRLSPWVVLRGMLAPALTPLLRGRFTHALKGCFMILGRIEGFVMWSSYKK